MLQNVNELFLHDLADMYDAEFQFLQAMHEMVQKVSEPKLQEMINKHIQETEQQIRNLDQVFGLLDAKPRRAECDGAKGIIQEGQKTVLMAQDNPMLLDVVIAGALDKSEHYEIAAYTQLVCFAQMLNNQEILKLLQQNLQQEEKTSQALEYFSPPMLQKSMASGQQVR